MIMMRTGLIMMLMIGISPLSELQANGFPYQLKPLDYAIISVSMASELYAMYLEDNQSRISDEELVLLDRNDINRFDRSATQHWNTTSDQLSDFLVYGLTASPCAVWLSESKRKRWRDLTTYSVMLLETFIFTNSIKDLTQSIVKRKRPYLYNTGLSRERRLEFIHDENVFDSFFSGHTTNAFSMSVFLATSYADLYGTTLMSKVIWGISLSAACCVGYFRYYSGYHYPTDIFAGAVLGSTVGYLIPVLHRQNSVSGNLGMLISPIRFNVSYRF